MPIKRRLLALTLSLVAVLSMAGVAGAQTTATTQTITEIVVADGNFDTLETAVVATGLADALQGEGPILVFAPTDDAFAALPPGALDALLAEPGLVTLTDVLLYHVITGTTLNQLLDADTRSSFTLTALNGDALALQEVSPTVASVNGVSFTVEDFVVASNGLIIIIDQVLLPPGFEVPGPAPTPTPIPPPASATNTVVDVVVGSEVHNTLETAVVAAGLVDTLTDPTGNYAVFAPTDAAFAALPDGTLASLLAEPGLASLTNILTYHVVSGQAPTSDGTYSLTTVNGATLEIVYQAGAVVSVNGVPIIAEVAASNGSVFVIEQVLLPPASDGVNPPNYPTDSSLIIPSTVETFFVSEEIIIPVPPFDFPANANGSYLIQLVQYPDGVNAPLVVYKSAQHWESSGARFVFGLDSGALIGVPSYIIITPQLFEQTFNAATGASEFSYFEIPGAPSFWTEQFEISN